MTTGNEEVKTTGDEERDVKILLADHAQSREEAGYRDRLFYEILIGMVVFIGVLIDALIRVDSYGMRLVICVVAFVIFLILSVGTWSIKNSRDAAWKHSAEIEKDTRLAGLIETSKSILDAGEKGNWFVRQHLGTLVSTFATVALVVSGLGIIFCAFCLIGCN